MSTSKNRRRPQIAPKCVLDAADGRLREIHHHWHACLDSYDEPLTFRISLNAAIQALRNVTFAVQKQKAFLAEHDDIYPLWQSRAASDDILKWVVRSRNRIVKEEDLDTASKLKIVVVVNYDDAARLMMESLRPDGTDGKEDDTRSTRIFDLPPRFSRKAAMRVLENSMPPSVLAQASIVMERRWVDSLLPQYELLAALAHAYSRCAQLLHDLHEVADIHHDVSMPAPNHAWSINTNDDQFSLPYCTATTREFRTFELDLYDDSVFGTTRSLPVEYSVERGVQAMQRYGPQGFTPPKDAKSPIDYIPSILSAARSIVIAGEQHAWFVWFFVGGEVREVSVIQVTSNASKRRFSQMVAEMCHMKRYDGILFVTESWVSPYTLRADGSYIAGRDHPERQEAIVIEAERADGSRAATTAIFRRTKDGIVFDDDEVLGSGGPAGFFLPVRQVWRRWNDSEG